MPNLLKSAFSLDFRQNITPPVEVTRFNITNGSLNYRLSELTLVDYPNCLSDIIN